MNDVREKALSRASEPTSPRERGDGLKVGCLWQSAAPSRDQLDGRSVPAPRYDERRPYGTRERPSWASSRVAFRPFVFRGPAYFSLPPATRRVYSRYIAPFAGRCLRRRIADCPLLDKRRRRLGRPQWIDANCSCWQAQLAPSRDQLDGRSVPAPRYDERRPYGTRERPSWASSRVAFRPFVFRGPAYFSLPQPPESQVAHSVTTAKATLRTGCRDLPLRPDAARAS